MPGWWPVTRSCTRTAGLDITRKPTGTPYASGDPLIRQSTSRTGACLDGAAAESFFATLKAEIGVCVWPDRAGARRDIENWIRDYNQGRLHSALDYRPPTETRRARRQRMETAV